MSDTYLVTALYLFLCSGTFGIGTGRAKGSGDDISKLGTLLIRIQTMQVVITHTHLYLGYPENKLELLDYQRGALQTLHASASSFCWFVSQWSAATHHH